MQPVSYLCLFRTHLWDSHIAAMAKRARDCTKSGAFFVLADESQGPLPVSDFFKYSHTDDVSEYGLPTFPSGKLLWWNADYPLYKIWQQYPSFDYYVMIEYDTFLNCDMDRIVQACGESKTDLVVNQLQPLTNGSHWSHKWVAGLGIPPWHALIAFLILSKRTIQLLFEYRKSLARQFREGEVTHWPYCEAFIPTAAKAFGLKIREAADFVDAELLQFRPYLSLRDERLLARERVAHPVLAGKRFVRGFVSEHPEGGFLQPDGSWCADLAREDPADLAAVIGPDGVPFPAGTPAPDPSELIDLARGKPATQSSWSEWSKGANAADDARRGNSGTLPDDYAFHTRHEPRPWWAVDLGAVCTVHAVELLNRVGGPFGDRFRCFDIETSTDGAEWTVRFSKTDETRVSSNPDQPAVFPLDAPTRARHVRIVKPDPGMLHLRRVRVMGIEDRQQFTAYPSE